MATVPNATPGRPVCPGCKKKNQQLYLDPKKNAVGCADCLGGDNGYPIQYPPSPR